MPADRMCVLCHERRRAYKTSAYCKECHTIIQNYRRRMKKWGDVLPVLQKLYRELLSAVAMESNPMDVCKYCLGVLAGFGIDELEMMRYERYHSEY